MYGYLTGSTFEHYNMCLHWAMERGSGWHSSFLHRALYTHTHTHRERHTRSQKPGICPALAGADAAMRTVISPTVAVATPTRGKSLIVCAHACVCVCVLVIVTEAWAGGREGGGGGGKGKGGPAGIHIVPGLFKVYASFTYYPLSGGILNRPFQLSRQ